VRKEEVMMRKREGRLSVCAAVVAFTLLLPARLRAQEAPGSENAGPALPATVYTADNAPPKPTLGDLPRRDAVSQYGITWTFEEPMPVGRFITGDWYVVGPATVVKVDPAALFGKDVESGAPWTAVPKRDADGKVVRDENDRTVYDYVDIDAREREEFAGRFCRNGSVLNVPPVLDKSGFDTRVRHDIYDPELTAHLPIRMKPGDALVSTISKRNMARGTHYTTTQSVAILTCLEEPVGADAFRPGYMDRDQAIYLARNLRRELLPTLEPVASTPQIDKLVPVFDRPWLEYALFHEDHAPYQMGGYGQGLARRGGDAGLVLCLDFTPEEKEPLLVGYIQLGIDLWGMLKAGHVGWQAWGGWNSGHKLPVIMAGVLLGDEEMASPSKAYPQASFQEDEQTGYGRTWRGAPVVFLGHSGVDARTGQGRARGRHTWGPYEHLHPSEWNRDNWQSDSYRRCCTSRTWPGTALAAKLMKLEEYWAHDAFFDYVDRWMTEDEAAALEVMANVEGGRQWPEWAWQGKVELQFHEEMWRKYRPTVQPPPEAWRNKAPVETPARTGQE
jgi:hypothetical protein